MSVLSIDKETREFVITLPSKKSVEPKPKLTLRQKFYIRRNKILERVKRANAFVQFTIFFALGFGGSYIFWEIFAWSVYYAILIPIVALGYPLTAFAVSLISVFSLWGAATLVWFDHLDRAFRIS